MTEHRKNIKSKNYFRNEEQTRRNRRTNNKLKIEEKKKNFKSKIKRFKKFSRK